MPVCERTGKDPCQVAIPEVCIVDCLLIILFLVLVCPDSCKEERPLTMHRRNSDSNLYCKTREDEGPKERTIQPDKPVESEARYLDQEKLAFVQSYLEKAEDARSVTTETSDSGMPGTHGAPSELGMEETSGKTNALFPHEGFKSDCELNVRLRPVQLRFSTNRSSVVSNQGI